jgi:hypothetical protein
MAVFIQSQQTNTDKASWFREVKSRGHDDLGGGLHYDRSPRHRLEVEFFAYRERLKKLVAKFG